MIILLHLNNQIIVISSFFARSVSSASVESSYVNYAGHASYSSYMAPQSTAGLALPSFPNQSHPMAPNVQFVDAHHQHVVGIPPNAATVNSVLNTVNSTAALLNRHRQNQQQEGLRISNQRNRSALRIQNRLSNENTLQW